MENLYELKDDELVKSGHSGENRSPDGLQLLERTGFRLEFISHLMRGRNDKIMHISTFK
jgi:hypothetical protein